MSKKNGKETKSCSKCPHVGPIEKDFGYRTVNGKKYAQSQCRSCRSGKKRQETPNPSGPMQVCSGPCGDEKPATTEFFPPSRFNKSGIRPECRECKNAKVREQRARRRKKGERRV